MSVKIRLAKRGRKKLPLFDIVVADSRSPRDGRFIEKLGTYNPMTNPATIELDDTKAFDWIMKGAQPTDTARTILSNRGIMLKKHLQVGVLKGAITQDQADKKLADWVNSKEAQTGKLVSELSNKKAAEKKARLEAEAKANEAKKAAVDAKKAASLAQEEPVAKEETPAEEPASTEEAKAE